MAPKRQRSALARTPVNQDVNMRDITTRKNDTPSIAQERSSPNGDNDDDFEEGDEDDDEDEDEEEDDDDDDDDEVEEEEEVVDDKGGFDEKFLAQLMAMDPIFSNKNAQNSLSSQKVFETPSSGTASSTSKDESVSTRPLNTASHGTPFPNMPAYASAASTPSNEFYDGAINFLTEVLGSSDPSMWNGTESQQNQNGWPSSEQQFSTIPTAASPAPTQAQFKNLQPLIGNLIARLKGQPVDESEQGARVLEDDLVVLLQSLMAQRQAQEERKNTQKSDKGQKGATNQADVQRKQAQTPQQSSISQPNNAFPTMDEINALAASFPIMPNANNSNGNVNQHPQNGFSIVDFDFGDDDDDPDFVPNNLSLTQPFDEGSQALAQALASTDGQNENTNAWQQMISSFGNPGTTSVGTGMPMSPAGGGEARRTRSVLKNVDSQTLNSTALKQLDNSLPPNTLTEDSREDGTSTTHESEEGNPKGRKRRVFTTEEALERRREANRECARRQRAKKKEETEAIRKELERIQALGIGGAKVGSENIIDVTQALVGRRKRGRPLGSRNRRTMYDMKRYSEEVEQETEMADLRADNRMLRAEMHRLQEENAKLRANALRHEEVMQMIGEHDLIKNQERRSGKRLSYGDRSLRNEEGSINDRLDEGDDLPNNLSNTQDPAGDFLAYNPFRSFQRTANGNAHSARESVDDPSLRRQEQNIDRNFPQSRRGARVSQRGLPATHQQQQQSSRVGNPSNSLQDLLQAAATEMGGYDYT